MSHEMPERPTFTPWLTYIESRGWGHRYKQHRNLGAVKLAVRNGMSYQPSKSIIQVWKWDAGLEDWALKLYLTPNNKYEDIPWTDL